MIFHGDKLVYSHKPIHEILLEKFETFPEKLALITAENESDCINYQEVIKFSVLISEWIVENGFEKGDVILLTANNHWKFFVAAIGAWRAGLIVSTASDQFTPYEMRYQIEDCEAKLIFADSNTFPVVLEASKPVKSVRNIVSFSSFDSIIGRAPRRHLKMPEINVGDDVAFLPYSSGTTGKPKGVMVSHQNLSMMLAASVQALTKITESFGLPADFAPAHDLHFLPMYHVMGMFRTLLNSFRGTCQVVFSKFRLQLVLKHIEAYSIMSLQLVPAILVRMINSPLLAEYDISSVASISVGSAPLPDGAVQKLRTILPDVRVVQGFGMTELTYASHFPTSESPTTSVGRLLPGTSMKVKRQDGGLCGPEEIGEMWIKGPQIMKGYWRRPELTDEMFDADGFMRTGDVVYFNRHGDTFVCDRIKELIKVNGKQVAPAELESLILEHADVADACVFGVEDVESGERPVACVVVRNGVDGALVKQSILAHVNGKLSRFKHLKNIDFVTEIQRTGTGKILRREMKKQFQDSRKSKL